MRKDLVTHTFSCSKNQLRMDIKTKLREEYPDLSEDKLNRYIDLGLSEIGDYLGNILYEGLVCHGVYVAIGNKKIDDQME